METKIIAFIKKEEVHQDSNLEVKLEIILDFFATKIRGYLGNEIIVEEKWTERKDGKMGVIFLVTGEKINIFCVEKYIETIGDEKNWGVIEYFKEKKELEIASEIDSFEELMFSVIRKKLAGTSTADIFLERDCINCTELLKFVRKLICKDNLVTI